MPTCYVMVGLPATGKSTRVKEICAMDPDVYVYSTDTRLEEIAEHLGKTYDDVFEKHFSSAKQYCDVWLGDAMKNGLNVVWDQTNLGANKRKGIVKRMKRAGYTVVCECYMHPNPSEKKQYDKWQKRLASRPGKTIPGYVLKNMGENFVIPKKDEGFDGITLYDMNGNELVGV